MTFIKKLLKSIDSSFFQKKISKDKVVSPNKSSKVYALERLKEIHNYDYISFVAKYYTKKNHTVWEYSKEKNLVNHPLNLVMKRDKDILLIQCRSNMGEVTVEMLHEFEKIGVDFLAQYALFKNYNIHYLFTCSEEYFSDEARAYIAKYSHVSYEILKEFDEAVK